MLDLCLSGNIRPPFANREHTMRTKLEQWREADRQAHEAELWLVGVHRRHETHLVPQADMAAAKGLRQLADRLFNSAMEELQTEIAQRISGGGESSSPH